MNESTVALSVADDPARVRWWVESDWRTGSWAEFAGALAGRRWIFLIDARTVSLFELSLPARDLATAIRAAPFALEEQLAAPLEDTAIALVARGDKAYTAAAWTRADLDTVRATLATCGLTPALVVPEALSLPWTPDSLSIALRDDWAVLRTGPGSGCAVAAASLAPALALVRQQYPAMQTVALYANPREARRFPRDAVAGLACHDYPPLDAAARAQALARVPVPRLLDASPRAAERRRAQRLWRVAAVLALACACAYPALLAYGTAVTTRRGADLEAANEARFRAAFPTITRVVNARVQANQAIAELRATAQTGPDFLALLAALDQALAGELDATTQVRGVAFVGGVLELSLAAADMGELERLRVALADAGLGAEMVAAEAGSDAVVARLRLTERS